MARKYLYKVYNYNTKQELGDIEASSFNVAYRLAQRQFGDRAMPRLNLSDDDEAYLRRVSTAALKRGDTTIEGMAFPWFRLDSSREIDETHYKNIIDAMPTDLQIAYYYANEEYDELEGYSLTDFAGGDPKKEINKVPNNQQTPELYAKVYAKFLANTVNNPAGKYYDGDFNFDAGAFEDALYMTAKSVPKNMWSEDLNRYIRTTILRHFKNDELSYGILDYMPESVFSPTFTSKLLQKNPNYIFDLPKNVATVEVWLRAIILAIRAGGFTAPPSDWGIDAMIEDETIPPQVAKDPRIVQLVAKYKEAERMAKERRDQEHIEHRKQQMDHHMNAITKDGNALGRVPSSYHTPEMYQAAINHDARAIFHVPSEARTKELWQLAVKRDSSMIEYVRPVELQAEIKKEMTGGADVERIKQLAGTAKPTESPPEEK
jgi:hypothetical protein